MWEIKVPASSANLGSGFDVLGCAISLYASFRIEESQENSLIGFEASIKEVENLFFKSYKHVCLKEGYTTQNIKAVFTTEIPMSRGLGSSSSLIVGGVTTALLMHTGVLDQEKALKYCAELEGHPDNVAPSLYGGLISSTYQDEKWTLHSHLIHKDLKWTFLIPDFELLTSLSRSVLPKTYSQETLDLSQDKLSKLLIGLETGNMDLIRYGCEDVLHQPYRFKLIEDISLIQNQLSNTSALYLSGAGPTLAIISKETIHLDLSKTKAHWNPKELNIDTEGVSYKHV